MKIAKKTKETIREAGNRTAKSKTAPTTILLAPTAHEQVVMSLGSKALLPDKHGESEQN